MRGGLPIIVAALVFLPVGGAEARFQLLGDLPGGAVSSAANDVSRDETAVGVSRSSASPSGQGFRWTAATLIQPLDPGVAAGTNDGARAISPAGDVIVGSRSTPGTLGEAARWILAPTGVGPAEGLGFLDGAPLFSRATDTCGDVIVGFAAGPVPPGGGPTAIVNEPFRWTEASQMESLGFRGQALGIAPDCRTIVGASEDENGRREAFRWNASQLRQGLGPFMPGGESAALDASGDGSRIVGWMETAQGLRAFLWRAETQAPESLGVLEGEASSLAFGISENGELIVGVSGSQAFVYSVSDGVMRSLAEALAEQNVNLGGVLLLEASAVTDGGTIVGTALNASGQAEGFLSTLQQGDAAIQARAIASGSDFNCVVPPPGLDALGPGTVECFGNFAQFPFGPGMSVLRIEAGVNHLCAIFEDASVLCTGFDDGSGKLGTPPGGAFTDLALGELFTCALTSIGAVSCSGVLPGSLEDLPGGAIVDIDARRGALCAVNEAGDVGCIGEPTPGGGTFAPGLELPPGDYVAVEVGNTHLCGLLAGNAMAVCNGDDAFGQLGLEPGTYRELSVGAFHTCGLRQFPADPTAEVTCAGQGSDGALPGQASPPPGLLCQAVETGDAASCCVDGEGVPVCWGSDASGQRGSTEGPLVDTDRDGFPDEIDNCDDDANPGQADADGDGVGDVCDNCPNRKNADQANTDPGPDGLPDAFGNLCDTCPTGFNPDQSDLTACQGIGYQVRAAPSPPPPPGGGNAAPEASYDIFVSCGNTDRLISSGFGIELPAGTDPNSIVFGNPTPAKPLGCDSAGCPSQDPDPSDPDPTDKIGDTVDITALPDFATGDLDGTYVLRPEDPQLPPSAPDDTLYVSFFNDAPNEGLCTRGNVEFLARFVVGGIDPATGFVPPPTPRGVDDAVGGLGESDEGEVDEFALSLTSGELDPAAVVRVTLQPAAGVPPFFDPECPGCYFTLSLQTQVDLSSVAIGLSGDGALSFEGCDENGPAVMDACFPTVPRRNCTNPDDDPTSTGNFGPSADANLDFNSPATFAVLPMIPADLPPNTNVQPDTLYLQFDSPVGSAFFPNFRSLLRTDTSTSGLCEDALTICSSNAECGGIGAGNCLYSTKLGTVRYDADDPADLGPPSVVLLGVQDLFQGERDPANLAGRQVCDPIPDFTGFQRTDESQPATAQFPKLFSIGPDFDNDGTVNELDLCLFRPDDGSDTGRFAIVTSPIPSVADGSATNGIGDVCECGNGRSDDGKVLPNEDTLDLQLSQVGAELIDEDACSSKPPVTCTASDWVKAKRAHEGIGSVDTASCAAGNP